MLGSQWDGIIFEFVNCSSEGHVVRALDPGITMQDTMLWGEGSTRARIVPHTYNERFS